MEKLPISCNLRLVDNLLIHCITGRITREEVANKGLLSFIEGIAERILEKIVGNSPYRGRQDFAYRDWGVNETTPGLEKLSRALQLVFPGLIIPAQIEGKKLSLAYKNHWEATIFKNGRIVLWEELSGDRTVSTVYNRAPALKVEKAFCQWLKDNATHISSINYLNLSCKNLRFLPPEIGQFSQLVMLGFSGNRLETLPTEIGQLPQLKYLFPEENQLKALPSEIGQLSQLIKLHLEENQLKTLPSEIGQLSQLNYLSLYRNQLVALPSEIGRLSKLRYLLLSGNRLETLPSEIGQLPELRCLSLFDNQLAALPSEIGQLSQLEELELSGNRLETLPPEIGQLPQLKVLEL